MGTGAIGKEAKGKDKEGRLIGGGRLRNKQGFIIIIPNKLEKSISTSTRNSHVYDMCFEYNNMIVVM